MMTEWHKFIQTQNLLGDNKSILIRDTFIFIKKCFGFSEIIPVLTVKYTYIIIQVQYFVRKNFLLIISAKIKVSVSVNLSPCQAG